MLSLYTSGPDVDCRVFHVLMKRSESPASNVCTHADGGSMKQLLSRFQSFSAGCHYCLSELDGVRDKTVRRAEGSKAE